eukprot:gene22649-42994_t
MENSGEDMVLFSSDFPHVEGGRNPLKRFGDNLAGVEARLKRKFYRDNFIDLMGNGLELRWRDPPLGEVATPRGKLRLTLSVGSGLARRRDGPAGVVWGLGDRGPNIKISAAIKHYGLDHLSPLKAVKGAKVLPLSAFQPMIAELQVG